MFAPSKNEVRELRPVVVVATIPEDMEVEVACTDKKSGEKLAVLPLSFFEKISIGVIVRQRVTDGELMGAVRAVTKSIVGVANGEAFAAPNDALMKNLLDSQPCMTYVAVLTSCAAVLILSPSVAVEDAETARTLLQMARQEGQGRVMWSEESGKFADALLGLSWAK
jgi:hypothetical protein